MRVIVCGRVMLVTFVCPANAFLVTTRTEYEVSLIVMVDGTWISPVSISFGTTETEANFVPSTLSSRVKRK